MFELWTSGPLGHTSALSTDCEGRRCAAAATRRRRPVVRWAHSGLHLPWARTLKSRKRLTFMPSAPRRCRTRTAGNRAKAAAPPPRPAAATTRRHRRRQEPATKLAGGTQCVFLAASFGQPAVHTSQMHCAPSNPPKIHIYVPCAPCTLTCTVGSRKRVAVSRRPAVVGPTANSRGGQAALPGGGSVRHLRLRSFPEPGGVAGGQRGAPLAAAGDAGRDPHAGRGAARRKDEK